MRRLQTVAGLLMVAGLAICTRTASAQVTLDFEAFSGMSNSPGAAIPAGARLSDQFLGTFGASFRSGSAFVGVVNLGTGHATSGTNGIGGSTAGGALTYSGSPLFTVTFFDPANTATQAVTNFVSVRGDLAPAGGAITLQAFDVNGSLIGSDAENDAGGTTLSLSLAGINSVRITGTGSVAFDDFRFNQVVAVAGGVAPEPATIALFAAGLLPVVGIIVRRRKKS